MRCFNSITRVLLVFAVAIVAFPAQDALANPLKKNSYEYCQSLLGLCCRKYYRSTKTSDFSNSQI